MPFVNKTPNYNFPQWVGTDYPSFVNDMNPAYLTIDTTLKNLTTKVNEAISAANSASEAASNAQQAAEDAATAAGNAVELFVALGVTDQQTAKAFKDKVDNAVPKYSILASYFDPKSA